MLDMSLIEFVTYTETMTHLRSGHVLAYGPAVFTNGQDIPIFTHAGCATSLGALYIIVIGIDDRFVQVLGYYDVTSEVYRTIKTPFSHPSLNVRGNEHGRFLHGGFPASLALPEWPIATLDDTRSTAWKLNALRKAKSVVIARDGIDTPELARALFRRMQQEKRRNRHYEVQRRNDNVWHQVLQAARARNDGALCSMLRTFHVTNEGHDRQKPTALHSLPYGRAVPDMCYEMPEFFEPPPHAHAVGTRFAHRQIHKRLHGPM